LKNLLVIKVDFELVKGLFMVNNFELIHEFVILMLFELSKNFFMVNKFELVKTLFIE